MSVQQGELSFSHQWKIATLQLQDDDEHSQAVKQLPCQVLKLF